MDITISPMPNSRQFGPSKCLCLKGNNESDGGQNHAKTSANTTGAGNDRNRAGGLGRNHTARANDSGSRVASHRGSRGRLVGRFTGRSGQGDVGNGHLGRNSLSAAVLGDGCSNIDGSVRNLSDHRSASDGDDLSNGGRTGSNNRVLGDVSSANTLVEGDSLIGSVALLVSVNAVENVLDELFTRADALGVRVVLAVRLELQEGVEARRQNGRARRSLSRLGGLAGRSRGLLAGRLLLGGLRLRRKDNSGRTSLVAGASLRDGADGGAHRYGDSNNVSSILSRALGHRWSTASDGLGGSCEDS